MLIELSHSETGSGQPLIILHGLFGSKRNWAGIAKSLGETHQVFLLDLRNHGDTAHDPEMTYEAMAEDVAFFIECAELGSVSLAGHSMGGKAAMATALTRPDLIERLFVLDIALIAYAHGFEDYIEVMESIDFESGVRRREIETSLARTIPDKGVRDFILQNLKTDADGHFSWRVNLDAIDTYMDDIVGFPDFDSDQAYEGPTLFVGGGESEYIQPYHMAEIERLFPMAEIDFIDGAGHWVHADAPAAFLKKLNAFLQA